MAGQEGLEPPTCGFGDRCSAKLSYWPKQSLRNISAQNSLPRPLYLLVDLGNHTGANRPSAFAYRKTQTFFHRNRCNQ